MNRLLVLYPIDENIFLINKDSNSCKVYNETIDKRYREKGYQVNFLTFKDKEISGKIEIKDSDRVLNVGMTYNEHTTPVGKKENGNDIYEYPENEQIYELLGETEELVICGFHADDCVTRTAEYFYNKGTSTLVDEELTDYFRKIYNKFYFNPELYNLANILTYNIAEETLEYGKVVTANSASKKEKYTKPWMHLEKFESDFTVDEAMTEIEKREPKYIQ